MKESWWTVLMAVMLGLTAAAATSTPIGFTDDYDAALARAKAEKKLVVADFSGSDWCFWCQRLDEEVFRQEAFVSEATNRYVLLMVDSPRDKSRLSEKAKVQNRALMRKYKVNAYPTVLLLDEEGKIVGETGFVGGGPENYLRHLEEKVSEIPDFLAYVKPLDQRISLFFNRYSREMSAEVAKVREDGPGAIRRVESETTLRLVGELERLIAEERVRTVPDRVVAVRAQRLKTAESSARQLREFAKRKERCL